MKHEFIPLSVPNLKGNELKYVTTAIKTEWISTNGPYVAEFETKVADYVHAKGAVSCQNGTSGLHIALLVTGVTQYDAVIVPTLTFIAAVNPVSYIHAKPIFMDCDDSLCIDPDKLEHFCEQECDLVDGKLMERTTGRHIKAVLVVHVFGNMADMVRICDIAKKYHIHIIEDATEAIGTYYSKGRYAGCYAGTIGDIGVYSFNGNKIMTTGGGGMIVSNNSTLLNRAKHLTTQAKSDELYYIHDEIGYNYRMTNLQAALGIAQLEQLEQFIEIKNENYNYYQQKISKIKGLKILENRKDIRSNCWFYSLFCDENVFNRDELIVHLAKNNVQSRPIWGLIHEQKPYEGNYAYVIEKAKIYWEKVVNIPCSTNLLKQDIDYIVKVISEYNR